MIPLSPCLIQRSNLNQSLNHLLSGGRKATSKQCQHTSCQEAAANTTQNESKTQYNWKEKGAKECSGKESKICSNAKKKRSTPRHGLVSLDAENSDPQYSDSKSKPRLNRLPPLSSPPVSKNAHYYSVLPKPGSHLLQLNSPITLTNLHNQRPFIVACIYKVKFILDMYSTN